MVAQGVAEAFYNAFNREKRYATRMKVIFLRLCLQTARRLQRLAEQDGRLKAFYMMKAIREHLDDLEDRHVAEERLAAYRSGQTKPVSLDEVERRIGPAS